MLHLCVFDPLRWALPHSDIGGEFKKRAGTVQAEAKCDFTHNPGLCEALSGRFAA